MQDSRYIEIKIMLSSLQNLSNVLDVFCHTFRLNHLTISDRVPVPEVGACDWGLKQAKCEDCKMYYDARPEHDHHKLTDGRCVWVPADKKCATIKWANQWNRTIDQIDETCSGK